jgi:O-antigen ligase
VIDKLLIYGEMWIEPFNDISLFDFIIGRGAGYSFNHIGYNEILGEYTYASHSLAHNLIVTIFMKFGLVGFILFSVMIFFIFRPLSRKFNFETSALLKLVLLLILFNFLTTPGIWKIGKGIFLWFVVGLCYFYRRYRVTGNV